MNLVKRVIVLFKKTIKSTLKDGPIVTFKRIIKKIKYKFFNKKDVNLNDYVNIKNFETVIVFENNFGWNKIMRQRPQQIANSLPDKTLMFYHSHEDYDYKNNDRVEKLKENLILIDLGYHRDKLLELLSAHNNKYLMVYSTDYIPYERIKMYKEFGYEIIYEYVDDFNADLSGKEAYKILKNRHKKLVKEDPFVICTASEIYEKVKSEKFKYAKLITNGVDYDHFKNYDGVIPTDLIQLKKKYKRLICYYGALASWFDYDLVKELAQNKNYGIILLGQDYDNTLEKSGVLDYENVHYLGKKDYFELPRYGYNMDIFMIPFIINDITKATSPVKIFEYMAMGKPIVTTALPECKKYESVLYSNNVEEFIENMSKAEKLISKRDYKKLLEKEAIENTWTSKSNDLVKFINVSHCWKLDVELQKILDTEKYERIVVWRSPFGWNVPLFQRPQHISKQLSKQKTLVFYEVTCNTDYVKTLQKLDKNLYLVNFQNYYVSQIFKEKMKKVKTPKYVQIYSTNWSMSIPELKEYKKDGFKVLYEYIDDISPELAGTDEIPQYVVDKYKYVMKQKDILIVTTAAELYKDVQKKRGTKNLVLSCNGVDYDFFQDIDKNYKFEKEFLDIINNGKVNVCYYGALATWFDYDLIRRIDATNKYNIILFGVKYDDSFDKSGINSLNNVYFLGSIDYKVLKNYANKVDILTIPFVINQITQATSPLKLFEYMALHKPIVTTAMNECKNYKSVQVANNSKEFIELLGKCKKLSKDKKYQELLIKEAKENDWKNKAKIIIELLKEVEK